MSLQGQYGQDPDGRCALCFHRIRSSVLDTAASINNTHPCEQSHNAESRACSCDDTPSPDDPETMTVETKTLQKAANSKKQNNYINLRPFSPGTLFLFLGQVMKKPQPSISRVLCKKGALSTSPLGFISVVLKRLPNNHKLSNLGSFSSGKLSCLLVMQQTFHQVIRHGTSGK